MNEVTTFKKYRNIFLFDVLLRLKTQNGTYRQIGKHRQRQVIIVICRRQLPLKPANTNEHRILPLSSSINIGEPVLNELDNDSIRSLSMTNDV